MENIKSNTEKLFASSPLSEEDLVKLKEATILLDEAYGFALSEDNFIKTYDGTIQVDISYGTYSERAYGEDFEGNVFPKPTISFTVLTYIIGNEKRNYFSTADEMLEEIRRWRDYEQQRWKENNKLG